MRREFGVSGPSIIVHCGPHMAAINLMCPASVMIFNTEILHYGSCFFAWLSRQKLESLSVEALIAGLEANGFQNANVSSLS